MVSDNCTISWNGGTILSSNTARDGNGGAIDVRGHSQVIWSAKTTFTNNSAGNDVGGAIALFYDSTASWNSEITFTKNTATAGSAVYIFRNYTVNFNGKTTFDANAVSIFQGGALSSSYSNVYFWDKTAFVGNTAITIGEQWRLWRRYQLQTVEHRSS